MFFFSFYILICLYEMFLYITCMLQNHMMLQKPGPTELSNGKAYRPSTGGATGAKLDDHHATAEATSTVAQPGS